MVILLDTHIAYWALTDDERLDDNARNIITAAGNIVLVSQLSVFEIQVKHMAHPDNMVINGEQFEQACLEAGFKIIPVLDEHIFAMGSLNIEGVSHKDPYDRLFLSIAKSENIKLMTHDKELGQYGERSYLIFA